MDNMKKVEVERTITVLRTYDYERFIMNEFNRDIKRRTVDEFIKDFKVDGYCTLFPIIVKEQEGKYLIIKGHHRYLALKESNMPIYFTVDNSLTDKDIIIGEKTQNKFSPQDCTKIYANLGNDEYIKYRKLIEESQLSESLAKQLLLGFASRGVNYRRKFIDEEIVITEEMETRFEERVMNIKRIKKCARFSYNTPNDIGKILFILDDSELTLKFVNYLHRKPYDITKSCREFKRIYNKTYKEDLMGKLSKIKL